MFNIIGNLFFPAAVGFINGFLHAFCHLICIKNYQAIHISCSTAGSLGKRFFIAQKTFFICIKNCNQ